MPTDRLERKNFLLMNTKYKTIDGAIIKLQNLKKKQI